MNSKKQPDVYFFNPTCEYAVANGNSSWQPNQLLQQMEKDFGTLPLFLAKPIDIVLVRKLPSDKFLSNLENHGIQLPRFVLLEEALKNKLQGENLNRLLPWGWSSVAHKLLEPLKKSCSSDFLKSPVANWEPAKREFYSKKFSLGILGNLLPLLPQGKVLPLELLPRVVTTQNEIQNLIDQWGKLMIKAPWSSSGRGLQPITKTPVVPKVWEKLMGIVKDQGYAIAEPFLDKVLDMALQFNLKAGKINYIGKSIFITGKKGQYQGNCLSSFPQNILPESKQFAEELPELLKISIIKILEESPFSKNYEGNFGVDLLIYRDKNGLLRVNPCLEINVRQNMGLISLYLEKYLSNSSTGLYKTFYKKGTSFLTFAKEVAEKYPAIVKSGKIQEGFLPLTEATKESKFGAYLIAGKQDLAEYYFKVLGSNSTQKPQNSYAQKGAKSISC